MLAGWTLPYQMDVHVVEARVFHCQQDFARRSSRYRGKAVDWHNAPDAPFNTRGAAAAGYSTAGPHQWYG